MVVWSGCLRKQQLEARRLAITCTEHHPDHTTIVEVDKSLFWLQTSVKTFLTNTFKATARLQEKERGFPRFWSMNKHMRTIPCNKHQAVFLSKSAWDRVPTRTHVHKHSHAHTHTHAYACPHTHTRTHARTHSHTHTVCCPPHKTSLHHPLHSNGRVHCSCVLVSISLSFSPTRCRKLLQIISPMVSHL